MIHRLTAIGGVALLAGTLLAMGPVQEEGACINPRTVIALDRDWRFYKGRLELPNRQPVKEWRYRMEPGGEAAAIAATPAMIAPGLDASGKDWKTGTRFEYGKDVTGQEWMEGGNLRPKGQPLFAWFRAEIPGIQASRPALELDQVQGLATLYVNGVKIARHDGRQEMFVVDLASVWKAQGVNSVAILIEAKEYGGLYSSINFTDLAAAVPASSPLSPNFKDEAWVQVNVPHDYVLEGPVTNQGADGYKRDYGWYRKSLTVPPSPPGSRVWLEFDGVYRMSRYWLNGKEIGIHPSGYAHARFDVTDMVQPGINTLVVSLDPTLAEGWWYDGGGIYRHVRMVVVSDVHVAPASVFVRSIIPDTRDGLTAPATLDIDLSVVNTRKEPVSAELEYMLRDQSGKMILRYSQSARLAAGENPLKQKMTMDQAKLWSCDHPELYCLELRVRQGPKVLDSLRTSFGVRKIEFHKDRGFLLNDRVVKIKGTANHQCHAGVGVAIPDRLHIWRLEQLKKMGCNAIRYSYEIDPVVYDACDRMGILVMGEFRHFGDTYAGKVSKKTATDGLRDQIREVKAYRNHPSIILWCLGNEEGEVQNNARGAEMVTAIKKMVDTYDGTRPVTVAVVGGYAPEGICRTVDVVGMNYHATIFDDVRKRFPNQPFIGTESASEISTRGYYGRTLFKSRKGWPDLFGDEKRGYLSNYSENGLSWTQSCEVNWKAVVERPWVSGTFVWTGFDYKGEPTPFAQPLQPSISSSFGILDTCGFPKDAYWYYQSWWSNEPVIHVFPHWNWAGKEGQAIPVWVHSNADEVELLLNGRSLGKKKMERNGHLEWQVPYTPGQLEARGFKGGRILTDSVETAGSAAGVVLDADRKTLTADGADLAWVGVSIVDDRGRLVPTADNKVTFSVKGPGRILGVGNGDSSSHEADLANERLAFNGRLMVLVQTTGEPGAIELKAESQGFKPVVCAITAK